MKGPCSGCWNCPLFFPQLKTVCGKNQCTECVHAGGVADTVVVNPWRMRQSEGKGNPEIHLSQWCCATKGKGALTSLPPFSVSRCHRIFSSSLPPAGHTPGQWRQVLPRVALHYFHDLPMSDIKTRMRTTCEPNGQRAVATGQVSLSRHGSHGTSLLVTLKLMGQSACAVIPVV